MSGILDFYIANKVLGAEPMPAPQESPYAVELNRKQPTQTREELLPKNLAEYPTLPAEAQMYAKELIDNLKKVQGLSDALKKKRQEFQESIQPMHDERDQLMVDVNSYGQLVGPAIQELDKNLDQVVTHVGDMFMLAQRVTKVRPEEVTMAPNAQLELLIGIIKETNTQVAEVALKKFHEALAKFTVQPAPKVDRDLRVWPIPQQKLKGKSMKLAQATPNAQEIRDLVLAGNSGLIQAQNILQQGMKSLSSNTNNNIVPMNSEVPMAAAAMKGFSNGATQRFAR